MKEKIENYLMQGTNLLDELEQMEMKNPAEFDKYKDFYAIHRLMMELIQYTEFKSTGKKDFYSLTGEFCAAILLRKGKVDLRSLFEEVYLAQGRTSMAKLCEAAKVQHFTASRYRNKKQNIYTDTWEKLMNEMIK